MSPVAGDPGWQESLAQPVFWRNGSVSHAHAHAQPDTQGIVTEQLTTDSFSVSHRAVRHERSAQLLGRTFTAGSRFPLAAQYVTMGSDMAPRVALEVSLMTLPSSNRDPSRQRD